MNSTTNDDDKGNNDMTWKVVRTGNSNTPLRKPKHYEQGQTNRNEREKVKRKNGSDQDDGGFRGNVHSGTRVRTNTWGRNARSAPVYLFFTGFGRVLNIAQTHIHHFTT
jgi:hypothetical protein